MFFDVLGVLIGFVSVMLLLSLLVTALVQLAQNFMMLRFRNLRWGLMALIPDEMARTPGEKRAITEQILAKPVSDRKVGDRFINPALTWIRPEEFVERLMRINPTLSKEILTETKAKFENIENYLSKRFQFHVRILSIVCAAAVAFVFQVGTLDLVKNLSVSPELRARSIAVARDLVNNEEPGPVTAPSYNYISDQALEMMLTRHPDLLRSLEEAAGLGRDRADILNEFNAVLIDANVSNRETIAGEYAGLLDSLYNSGAEQALAYARQYSEQLAIINITLWPEGWKFYKDVNHWIGFIITIILLSFGAPFWYEMLSKLLKLKDQLQPKQEDTMSGKTSNSRG